ncbi:hypothetical protein [Propylenella binzhouense]|nr:hypothetical protein [Propylenella binzhouense]
MPARVVLLATAAALVVGMLVLLARSGTAFAPAFPERGPGAAIAPR